MDTTGSIGIYFRNMAFLSLFVGAAKMCAINNFQWAGFIFISVTLLGLFIHTCWGFRYPHWMGWLLKRKIVQKYCSVCCSLFLFSPFFLSVILLIISLCWSNWPALIVTWIATVLSFNIFFMLACFSFMRQQLSTFAEAWAWSGERKLRFGGQLGQERVISAPNGENDPVIQNIIWNLEYWYLKEGKPGK